MNFSKLTLATFALLIPATVFAEPATTPPLEVVVTAGRGLEQNPLDVPQSITAITREELDSREGADLDDIIRQEAGVGMGPAEGNPNYWQEGFTLRGLGAQRVLTLTDGVRQAGQGIGYGGGNMSLYDSYGVERIEILKGPASVLYGTDAFGGVINVITREPERRSEYGTNMGGRYTFDGARDSHRYGAYIDTGDSNYGLVLGGGYYDAERPNLPDDEEANGGSFSNYGFNTKFDYYFNANTKVRVIGNIDHNDDVVVADSVLPLPIAVFGRPGSSQIISNPLYFEFPQYGRSLFGAEIERTNLDGFFNTVTSGIFWQQTYRRFHRETAFYPTFSPGFAGPPTFVNTSASITRSVVDTDDQTDTIEWHTQARAKVASHNLIAGLDVGFDQADLPEIERQTVVARAGLGAITAGPETVISRKRADAEQVRVGLYLQDTFTVNGIDIIPGVRGDYYGVKDSVSDYDDDEYGLSGNLGAVYKAHESASYYMNLASGFRAPDLGERFQNGIVNLAVPTRLIGKNDLESERAWTAEIGSKHDCDRFIFDFATYVNSIEDYIGTESLGVVNGLLTDQFVNVGGVTLYGTEGSVTYKNSENWRTYANAARTWADHTDKIDVTNWVFNYGSTYFFGISNSFVSKVSATIEGRTVLDSDDNTETSGRDQFQAGSFTTADILLNLDLATKSWGRTRIISGVRNIFDRRYQEPFFPQNQPGINAYIGVEVDY